MKVLQTLNRRQLEFSTVCLGFKFKTYIDELPHLKGMHYLHIPASIVKKAGGTKNKRFECVVNNELRFKGGFVALGEGCAYITITKARMKQAGVKCGDEVQLQLIKDESAFGMEIPEVLKEYLAQDIEANRRFNLLSPGKKRYIIHYVAGVKSITLQLERAHLLLSNLKLLKEGKESFREMLGLPPRTI